MGVLIFLAFIVLYSLATCENTQNQQLGYYNHPFDFDYRLLPREKRYYEFGDRLKIREKRNRPNYYPNSLPLPSPFVGKENVRDKRNKPDKILHPPLRFSYNKDQIEDKEEYIDDLNEEATNDKLKDYETEDLYDYEDYPEEAESQQKQVEDNFEKESSESYGKEPEVVEEKYKKSSTYTEAPKRKITISRKSFAPEEDYLDENPEFEEHDKYLDQKTTTVSPSDYYYTEKYAKYAKEIVPTVPYLDLDTNKKFKYSEPNEKFLYQEVIKPKQRYLDVETKSKKFELNSGSKKFNPQQIREQESQNSKIVEDAVIAEQKKVSKTSDSVPSEQKHHQHAGPKEHKQGGGKEHHSEHHAAGGEEGEKKYEGDHKYDKSEKGHHDKEGHKGKYDDAGGHKKKFHKDDGYFGGHKQGEEGEKGAEFKEHGKHDKGHSTKGEHNIHKKEEYEKTKHFYDESHEEGEHEKHGGYHKEHAHKKGGKHKYGHLRGGYKDHHYGKKGKHAKGDHYHENKGHKEAGGHSKHYKHKDQYGKKHGEDKHKKWGFKHAHKG